MSPRLRKALRTVVLSLLALLVVSAVVLKLLPYRESAQDQRFYFPSKDVGPVDGVMHESLWFVAPDGARINGLMLQPDRAAKATVLMLHGSGGNAARYVDIARPIVASGYQVLIVDWRGFGLTDGAPTHANVLSDSQLVLDQLQADLRGKPLLLWGLSMGGQVAIELARLNQDKVDGLVIEGAVTSFRDLASDSSPAFMSPVLWLVVKGPYEGERAIGMIDDMPKLIVHSRDDSVVPLERGLALHAAAKAPKVFWQAPGAHLGAMENARAEYVRRFDALLVQASAD